MIKRSWQCLVSAIGFVAILIFATTSQATVAGSCVLSKMKFVTVTTAALTTSPNMVPVPKSKIALALSKPGCVVVQFFAEANAEVNGGVIVQALIDDLQIVNQAPITTLTRGDGHRNDRATVAIFLNVAAGSHFVQMKYASANGDQIYLSNYTVIVQY